MKFLVQFKCTNCTLTKYCSGMNEIEAGDWKDAAENTVEAVALACGIPDQKINVTLIERVADNPLAPPPE